MLLPLFVYGAQVTFWTTKIATESWPLGLTSLIYALGSIALLLMVAYSTSNGHIEGYEFQLSVVLPGFVTLISVLIKNYLLWGSFSIYLGFESIMVVTFFTPLILMLWAAVS
ncbi:hypothetical protein KCQ_05036 [Pectobacterium atrosepticum ICMP 1526]|nr:hypothetical protein JV34_23165 [Pectobacterium atrosepticum]KMK87577.1 hypothetical protein KCQ_05036 [Pectobacterium atrosepticum ICMP 1526]